eukprot:TRINITY_DN6669_c0_g2_i1.p1 TRINITY_DN6669_c0_g2~~TRINITY_DN6669_c0_g2_i1.p1  ORF type:complete len:963 (+),score=197.38 TRINITY_DN6669_c0_g2_i1:98-2890(+)
MHVARVGVAAALLLCACVSSGQGVNCGSCQNAQQRVAVELHRGQKCSRTVHELREATADSCARRLENQPECAQSEGVYDFAAGAPGQNCRCCALGTEFVDDRPWSVHSFEKMLECACSVDLAPSGALGAIVGSLSGTLHMATRVCSHKLYMTITGNFRDDPYNFIVDDVQRDTILYDNVCRIAVRFEDVHFTEDGARLCPILDFGACGGEQRADCVSLQTQDGCLKHVECGTCIADDGGATGQGCGWCFDTGHCLPRHATQFGDRCGTCFDWSVQKCPEQCPGVLDAREVCFGHGECVKQDDSESSDRICACQPDWDQAPPLSNKPDCAVYTPPNQVRCPNQPEAFKLQVTPRSLSLVDGWLYAVWRAPAQGVAQLGVGVVSDDGAARRDDVPWALRYGAPPVGDESVDDYTWGGPGSSVIQARNEGCLASSDISLFHYVSDMPAYRRNDIWVALKFPNASKVVDFSVVFAEVRCAAQFGGARCEHPLTRTNSRWFEQRDRQQVATVYGGVRRGAWHFVEVDVPEGTAELRVRAEGEGDLVLSLRRGGVPSGSRSWLQLATGPDLHLPYPEPSPKWFVGVRLAEASSKPATRFTLTVTKSACPLGEWGHVTEPGVDGVGVCGTREHLLALGKDTRFVPNEWGKRAEDSWSLVSAVTVPAGVRSLTVSVTAKEWVTGRVTLEAPAMALATDGEWVDMLDAVEGSSLQPAQNGTHLQWQLPRPVKGKWFVTLLSSAGRSVTVRAEASYCDGCSGADCVKGRVVVCVTPEVNGERIVAPCASAASLAPDTVLQDQDAELPTNEEMYQCKQQSQVTELTDSPAPNVVLSVAPIPEFDTAAPRTPAPNAATPPPMGTGDGGSGGGDGKVKAIHVVAFAAAVGAGMFVAGAVWHARYRRRRRMQAAQEYDPCHQGGTQLELEAEAEPEAVDSSSKP